MSREYEVMLEGFDLLEGRVEWRRWYKGDIALVTSLVASTLKKRYDYDSPIVFLEFFDAVTVSNLVLHRWDTYRKRYRDYAKVTFVVSPVAEGNSASKWEALLA